MKLIASILLLLWMGSAAAYPPISALPAKDSLSLLTVAQIKGDFFLMDADVFGNVYAISRNGKLTKYNAKGDSLNSWNDVKRFGIPDALDVSNPLKPLVLCGSLGQLIILDKLLIPRNVIQLKRKGIIGPSIPTSSYDNQIWIFDSLDFKLKKINDNGETVFETTDWRMSLPESFQPYGMTDQLNNVFMFSAENELFAFDHYGYLMFKRKMDGGKIFGITGKDLYQYGKGKLLITGLENETRQTIDLSESNNLIQHICIRNEYLFILQASGITIFRIEKN